VQIRRVLLLFALVLGLSALVAALAPPPETDEDEPAKTTATRVAPPPVPGRTVTLPGTRRVPVGARFTLEVPVREPGDVAIDTLGLRQSADPLAPARFELLADRPGPHEVDFVPLRGERRVLGRLEFAEAATVTPPQRGR
jgi:hypothetical protein